MDYNFKNMTFISTTASVKHFPMSRLVAGNSNAFGSIYFLMINRAFTAFKSKTLTTMLAIELTQPCCYIAHAELLTLGTLCGEGYGT